MQSLHPVAIFAYFAGLGLLCMVLFHPLFLSIALVLLLLQVAAHGAWHQLRQWMMSYIIIGLTIMIWNPLFSHRGGQGVILPGRNTNRIGIGYLWADDDAVSGMYLNSFSKL